eukprot:c12089_g1_i2.p1 GENE.c12089_g1_i2~~c12089_g1_i2.p1  ORF type:complete len:299 (+),score=9.80 c12089_g1_i2:257-1153(+)
MTSCLQGIRKGNWTAAEDTIICEMVAKYGTRWALISRSLPGRTDNSVKNRYKGFLRKGGSPSAAVDADEDDEHSPPEPSHSEPLPKRPRHDSSHSTPYSTDLSSPFPTRPSSSPHISTYQPPVPMLPQQFGLSSLPHSMGMGHISAVQSYMTSTHTPRTHSTHSMLPTVEELTRRSIGAPFTAPIPSSFSPPFSNSKAMNAPSSSWPSTTSQFVASHHTIPTHLAPERNPFTTSHISNSTAPRLPMLHSIERNVSSHSLPVAGTSTSSLRALLPNERADQLPSCEALLASIGKPTSFR